MAANGQSDSGFSRRELLAGGAVVGIGGWMVFSDSDSNGVENDSRNDQQDPNQSFDGDVSQETPESGNLDGSDLSQYSIGETIETGTGLEATVTDVSLVPRLVSSEQKDLSAGGEMTWNSFPVYESHGAGDGRIYVVTHVEIDNKGGDGQSVSSSLFNYLGDGEDITDLDFDHVDEIHQSPRGTHVNPADRETVSLIGRFWIDELSDVDLKVGDDKIVELELESGSYPAFEMVGSDSPNSLQDDDLTFEIEVENTGSKAGTFKDAPRLHPDSMASGLPFTEGSWNDPHFWLSETIEPGETERLTWDWAYWGDGGEIRDQDLSPFSPFPVTIRIPAFDAELSVDW